ncbi:hypothetical protein [Kurthia sp. Dielmo]|uniref:hypothetical protein n=1 Tax=Kurthia sp. Dielmo TaxID=1033738 RepID=UPI00112047C9|nr:hypothetical protein [Kurthia sp. Dielmo]
MDKLLKIAEEVEHIDVEDDERIGWFDIPEGDPTISDKLMTVGVLGFLPAVAIASGLFVLSVL